MELNHVGNNSNLLTCIKIIWKRKIAIAVVTFILTIFSIIYSLCLPKFYGAEAVIMPALGSGFSSSFGQLGNLASLVGLSGGIQTPSQQIMALLRTRTLAEEVINELGLLPVLIDGKPPDPASSRKNSNLQKLPEEGKIETKEKVSKEDAYKMECAVLAMLQKNIHFFEDKKTDTVSISSEFRDPQLAADVANSYVRNLQKFINDNSFTVAKRYRVFIEGRLTQNKQELLEAGKRLNEFYKGNKVSSINSKVDVPISPIAENINYESSLGQSAKEDLETMLTKKNDVEKKLHELQLVKAVPQQVYLQYLTLQRNLLAQINGLLSQQYEIAKMEESKNELSFQVIDPARVPGSRSRPKRKKIVMAAFIASIMIGVSGALSVEHWKKIRKQINS